MIESLLPSAVVAVEAFGDLDELFDFATEKRLVAGAVEPRRREFMTARRCAHEALRRMGITPVPIGSGDDRAPIWPAGLVGSITHCDSYRAAALARRSEMASVGIDAEVNQPLPARVGEVVLRPAERSQLRSSSLSSRTLHWDRLFFSCKEAVYKAWYPLTGHWLDFTDVEVVVDSVGHEFCAHVLADCPRKDEAPPHAFRGRYVANAQLIVTAVTVAGRQPEVVSDSPGGQRARDAGRLPRRPDPSPGPTWLPGLSDSSASGRGRRRRRVGPARGLLRAQPRP